MISPAGRDKFHWLAFGGLSLFFLGWVLITGDHPFFWDNILNAKLADFYLEKGFSSLIPPLDLDAGHPPLFNLYLAAAWKIFGRSLWVSHLAMLPILVFFSWHWVRFTQRFVTGNWLLIAATLPVLETSMLAQSSQISPDLALIALTFAAANFIMDKKHLALSLVLVLLSMVSMRGILALPALGIFELWMNRRALLGWLGKMKWMAWVPVVMVMAGWFFLHAHETGWWLSPPQETYGQHREVLGLSGIFKNFIIIGWRFVDQGHLAYFIGTGTLVLLSRKTILTNIKSIHSLLVFSLLLIGILSIISLPLSNTIGMRYFMPGFLLLGLIMLWMIQQTGSHKPGLITGVLTALLLYSGHFWIWPDSVAKSWDTTIAHFSWFDGRNSILAEIKTRNFSSNQICTSFPGLDDPSIANLESNRNLQFHDIQEDGMTHCQYLFYSNVMNGFSDEQLDALKNDWEIVYQRERNGVNTILYKIPSQLHP